MSDNGSSSREHLLRGPLGEAIMRQWDSIDLGEPEVAWAAAEERFRVEARLNQRCADSRRRDAADATEQADRHQALADDFTQLANAIAGAPVAFLVRDSGSRRDGEDSRSEAECEARQSGDSETGASPEHSPSSDPTP